MTAATQPRSRARSNVRTFSPYITSRAIATASPTMPPSDSIPRQDKDSRQRAATVHSAAAKSAHASTSRPTRTPVRKCAGWGCSTA